MVDSRRPKSMPTVARGSQMTDRYDYAQDTVQLYGLQRDICQAMRDKDYQAAITLCSALCLCAATIAVEATERKCDEVLDTVWPE